MEINLFGGQVKPVKVKSYFEHGELYLDYLGEIGPSTLIHFPKISLRLEEVEFSSQTENTFLLERVKTPVQKEGSAITKILSKEIDGKDTLFEIITEEGMDWYQDREDYYNILKMEGWSNE